jgi:hypothetical protein
MPSKASAPNLRTRNSEPAGRQAERNTYPSEKIGVDNRGVFLGQWRKPFLG